MPLFTKESLERLRGQIDLVEALAPYVDLKRAGTAYKALCPFHSEKTPSFVVQKGDTHYHCFGCGAHGDAIQFLMTHQNFTFAEAVEALGERFHVPMQMVESEGESGVSRAALREALELACAFFHSFLLSTDEGKGALAYLQGRGLTLDFIRRFEIGYAPAHAGVMRRSLNNKGVSDKVLGEAGLLQTEGRREFFRERITFPIRSGTGAVIGFSARKIREETFGGKYINSPETPLFKKSHTLFGLSYCRKRMAKERRAIIVEGQIDALRMIEAGLNLTVAALGTAFGNGHVRQLEMLGVRQATLLFDADAAGAVAASKVGDLFQKAGMEVRVAKLPEGSDPDALLTESGPERLIALLDKAAAYLAFQVEFLSKEFSPETPAGKNELARTLVKQIRAWEQPVMVHESLRQLARLLQLPEETLGTERSFTSRVYTRTAPLQVHRIDPDRVLELDLLRWLVLSGGEKPELFDLARQHLTGEHFFVPICRKIFESYLEEGPRDLLSMLVAVGEEEAQSIVDEILEKKVNRDRAELHFKETVQKILDRQWLQKREEIKLKIDRGGHSDEEVLELAKAFNIPRKIL